MMFEWRVYSLFNGVLPILLCFVLGRAPDGTQLIEAKQRRSAMLRANHHMQGNVITTGSKTRPKRTDHVRKPFAVQTMKVYVIDRLQKVFTRNSY